MKHINKISFVICGLLFAILPSCEKHDFFDENTITGEVGPQAYWVLGSDVMAAGSNIDFTVQYYSTVSEIERSEVWYNITETLDKKVSCPWVTTFTYSYSSTTSEEKRASQKIQEYSHGLAVWSDTLRAYAFTDKFPASGTLSTFKWVKPEQFDSIKMETYFGEGFMQHFKDSLYNLMQFGDFQKMLLGMNLLEDFRQYTDSTKDENQGEDVYVYHFPKDAEENTPVPQDVKNLYDGIPFDKLIENGSAFDVEFTRSYSLNAILRVYDVWGVYGTTTFKKIDIN